VQVPIGAIVIAISLLGSHSVDVQINVVLKHRFGVGINGLNKNG